MLKTKISGIYSITSKTNKKRYVGSSNRISTRWAEHIRNLKCNKHDNKYLQNHFNKYGKEDFIFEILEHVERGNLCLIDFKKLLLEREQFYLNDWKNCEFNLLKIAGSPLGHKRRNSKYYIFDKKQNKYCVKYILFGKTVYFGAFIEEKDAINQVELIKSMSEEELMLFWETNFNEKKTYSNRKNYTYNKSKCLFSVYFNFNKVKIHFGYHQEESKAIEEVNYLKSLSDKDKIKYYENTYKGKKGQRLGNRRKNTKGYYYNKALKMWSVKFQVNGKKKSFGSFNTEIEAKEKANQVKKELGWPD
jgi:group I intron endonuclease